MKSRPLLRSLIVATISATLGFGIGYWYWSRQTELLHVMDATNRIELFANLLEQLERNDIEGAKAACRELVRMARLSIDAIAPADSRFADAPEVVAARKKAAEIADDSN